MWGEEPSYFVVVKGEAGGATADRVGREVGPAGQETCLQLCEPVPALTERQPNAREVSKVEEHRTRIPPERLVEAEETCGVPEVTPSEEFELLRIPPIVIGAARDSVDGIDDDVGLEQRRLPAQEVRRRAAGGERQHGG
jgi:hypothetical protein